MNKTHHQEILKVIASLGAIAGRMRKTPTEQATVNRAAVLMAELLKDHLELESTMATLKENVATITAKLTDLQTKLDAAKANERTPDEVAGAAALNELVEKLTATPGT